MWICCDSTFSVSLGLPLVQNAILRSLDVLVRDHTVDRSCLWYDMVRCDILCQCFYVDICVCACLLYKTWLTFSVRICAGGLTLSSVLNHPWHHYGTASDQSVFLNEYTFSTFLFVVTANLR
jgi:hypothetical protein